jgi:hypothetical protein
VQLPNVGSPNRGSPASGAPASGNCTPKSSSRKKTYQEEKTTAAELQARIEAEQAALQNEQTKLDMYQLVAADRKSIDRTGAT